ncbi:hypothetical protein B1992_00080 [Pseudoxanthomonas broegbernensis]|uniref:Uncharacterized protein n=1 Tax=Pseudoxanthomonas broegbernensis TaxID=83619 RepID=A0A7V8K8K8_9GAMM|nr:hypothetical protein [Pseudoxanthomonas broegbernensis]KAF1687888.1 hypothetical protein B1992_00080 [Pseudoxanthomonas broegbernensis]MBB6064879.1 hypothetical protein [Pseudoxanthomonas broegbernensis]
MTQPPSPTIPQDTAYTLKYEDGMFLTSGEMTLAQNYFVNWLQLQNQLLFTPGVLSGLMVTNPSGNTLAVESGAGFDSAGHFVILPEGAGNTITVPANAANPSFIGLVYPSTPQSVSGQPYVVDMAGTLQVANSVDQLPGGSIVLAQINLQNGGIESLQDMRAPVTSRLPADLGVEPVANRATALAIPGTHGVASIPATGLRRQGDSVTQSVYYRSQQTAAFDRNPQVLITVLGNLPYATSVSDVGPEKFSLTLTSVLAPSADSEDPIRVRWFAYV